MAILVLEKSLRKIEIWESINFITFNRVIIPVHN